MKQSAGKKLKPAANQAIIPLKKPEFCGYLRSIFQTTKTGALKLTRKEFAGRFIFSLRKYSAVPVKQDVPDGWHYVIVEFPKSEFSHSENYFNYFTMEHTERINDFIQSSFDLFFNVYFFDNAGLGNINTDGYATDALPKMMLVDSFIFGLNLIDFESASETIKKREYRKELDYLRKKREEFRKKEYRYRKKIYETRLKFLQDVENE